MVRLDELSVMRQKIIVYYFEVWNCYFDVDISIFWEEFYARNLRIPYNLTMQLLFICIFFVSVSFLLFIVCMWMLCYHLTKIVRRQSVSCEHYTRQTECVFYSGVIEEMRNNKNWAYLKEAARKFEWIALPAGYFLFLLFISLDVYYTNWPWIYAQTIFLLLARFSPQLCLYITFFCSVVHTKIKTNRLMSFPFYLRAISGLTDDLKFEKKKQTVFVSCLFRFRLRSWKKKQTERKRERDISENFNWFVCFLWSVTQSKQFDLLKPMKNRGK